MKGPNHPAFFVKPWSALVGHNGKLECRPAIRPRPPRARTGDDHRPRGQERVAGDGARPRVRLQHPQRLHLAVDADRRHLPLPRHPPQGRTSRARSNTSTAGSAIRAATSRRDTFTRAGPLDRHARRGRPTRTPSASRCSHEGRLVTDDTTANLTFKAAEVISFVSHYMTAGPRRRDLAGHGAGRLGQGRGGAERRPEQARRRGRGRDRRRSAPWPPGVAWS